MLLTCNNIKIGFGVETILEDVSFSIDDGEKVAIVGVNGAGKTTLLKIITGEYEKTGGELAIRKDIKIGYLSQMTGLDENKTIKEELTSVFNDIIKMEEEMRKLEVEMTHDLGLMDRYSKISHKFEEQNGYEYKSRIRGVIKGLNFSEDEANSKIKRFSGGQKTRIALGKLLLSAPDLLLLDEPTNHLDIESINWLEDTFIKGYQKSVIIISHDRYFLDKTVGKIVEIENKKSVIYNGNYEYYSYKKEIDREIQLKHYFDQQKDILRQEEVIKKLRSFNREKSIKRAESRERLLSKIDRLERPESAPDRIRMVLEPRFPSGNDVLKLDSLKKEFPDGVLFENVTFQIQKGDIVALIGPNGIGKTTLLNIIKKNGEQAGVSGNVRLGANVSVGYYDQEHATLHDEKTIFDELKDAYPMMKALEIRNLLASFVFVGDDVFKQIGLLSGGEKGRVALAKIIAGNANFLLLDEPTNHLDINSREILEEALRNYAGTVLYISHDRYFINSTAEKIIDLGKNGVTTYLGNYDYYLEKKAEKQVQLRETKDEVISVVKNNWLKNKNSVQADRKRNAKIQNAQREIARMEEKIAELDEKLEREEINTNPVLAAEAYEEKIKLEEKLLQLYEQWEEISY